MDNGCIVAALNQVVTRMLYSSFNLLISVEELNIWLSCIIAEVRKKGGGERPCLWIIVVYQARLLH